jgi:hypothetical protein
VLGQFATILARTDPFDLAQSVERYIRLLSPQEVRAIILAANPRLSEWYRNEFLSLLNETDGDRLKAAFAHALKSNLRAIPLFGEQFCEGVIAQVPSDRAVGIGEEGYQLPRVRPLAVAIVALALLIGGAAAQRFIATAEANARGPVVLVTPVPVTPAVSPPVAPAIRHARHVALAPQIQRTAAPVVLHRARIAATPVFAAPPAPAPVILPKRITRTPRTPHTPPPGSGVKTIVAQQRPAPTAEPTALDVNDMPRSYSDATPLPQNATPPPIQVAPQDVATPVVTAAPSRGSWLHRTIMHLDPLKPNSGGWIYNSVKHLDPFKPHPQPSPTATATGGPQQ